MQASQVFTPGKLPEITYIDDHLQERVQIMKDALDMGASVISLSGPSKSGKTVFIEKTIGKERLIQVTGAGINSSQKLWDRVFDIIGTPVSKRKTDNSGFQGNFGAKISAEAGILVSAKGEASTSGTWSNGSSQQTDYSIDYLQLLIRELSGTDYVVFIDDFHYIPRDIQIEISYQIKEAIRSDVKFVVASVPYHSDDAIRANPDLRGRTLKLDFDYWNPEELVKIANRGFKALNIKAPNSFIQQSSEEAAGSPQLMQAICLMTCYENDFREYQDQERDIDTSKRAVEKILHRTSMLADYSSTVEKMKDGPKTRGTDRKSYILKNEELSDVYPLILKAIALDPPELTLRYPNLLSRIQILCKNDTPSGSSVTGACSHIASIANESGNNNIIEWDTENDVLDIRDPYLLFYLRWNR